MLATKNERLNRRSIHHETLKIASQSEKLPTKHKVLLERGSLINVQRHFGLIANRETYYRQIVFADNSEKQSLRQNKLSGNDVTAGWPESGSFLLNVTTKKTNCNLMLLYKSH